MQMLKEILYPRVWEYAVIGKDENEVKEAIFQILDIPFRFTRIRPSSKGNFISVHIILEVDSQDTRDSIFRALSAHKHIKMVI